MTYPGAGVGGGAVRPASTSPMYRSGTGVGLEVGTDSSSSSPSCEVRAVCSQTISFLATRLLPDVRLLKCCSHMAVRKSKDLFRMKARPCLDR